MARSLSLLFIPQEGNNHRALLLHPSFLGIFIGLYLLNQSLLRSFTIIKPGVLGYSSEITANRVLSLTNIERQKLNLPPLHYNPLLSQSATLKAQDMFAGNYWAHTSPTGTTPWDFFRQVDYRYSVAGENLAKDFYDTDSMLQAWMKSPTHRANIISNRYREIGIGVVNGVLGGVKTTLVVQHFGTPLTAVSQSQPVDNTPVIASAPELQTGVLASSQIQPTVSPLQISKLVSSLMFSVIMVVLAIDAYVVLKNKTHRLAGSATGHIGFLAIIFLLMLFSQQGSIF